MDLVGTSLCSLPIVRGPRVVWVSVFFRFLRIILMAKVEPFKFHNLSIYVSINDTDKVFDESAIRYSREKVSEGLKFQFIDIFVAYYRGILVPVTSSSPKMAVSVTRHLASLRST